MKANDDSPPSHLKNALSLRRYSIAMRRATGLYVDASVIVSFSVLPLIVHVFLEGHSFSSGLFDAMSSVYGGGIRMLLYMATPIPFILLRLIKTWTRVPTPGEFISGCAIVSRRSPLTACVDQCVYGFFQYMILFVTVIGYMLLWTIFASFHQAIIEAFLASELTFAVVHFFLLNIWTLCVLFLLFIGSVDESMASGFDRMCKLEVLPLRNEERGEIDASKSAIVETDGDFSG